MSTVDQSPARQLDGVQVDRTYTGPASGSTTRREQLDELRRFVRDRDTVVVHSMDLHRGAALLRRLAPAAALQRLRALPFIEAG